MKVEVFWGLVVRQGIVGNLMDGGVEKWSAKTADGLWLVDKDANPYLTAQIDLVSIGPR